MNGLVRFFRGVGRYFAVIIWFFYCAIRALWQLRWYEMKTPERVRAVIGYTQHWAHGLLRILGIEVRVEGELPADGAGHLLISNHQGTLDILVHAAVLGMRFTPNSGIRNWFLLGKFVQLSEPVWVDRNSHQKSQETLEEFRDTLDMGVNLMIYPEGTTTDGNQPLLPFKNTAFETVAGTDQQFYPILTRYHLSEGDKNPAWSEDTSFTAHVLRLMANKHTVAVIHVLPPIDADRKDRKELAAESYQIMNKEYQRLRGLNA